MIADVFHVLKVVETATSEMSMEMVFQKRCALSAVVTDTCSTTEDAWRNALMALTLMICWVGV